MHNYYRMCAQRKVSDTRTHVVRAYHSGPNHSATTHQRECFVGYYENCDMSSTDHSRRSMLNSSNMKTQNFHHLIIGCDRFLLRVLAIIYRREKNIPVISARSQT